MTVRELINELLKIPPDAQVMVDDWNEMYVKPVPARVVFIRAGVEPDHSINMKPYECDTVIITSDP